ncbi:MAG: hypothetical protein QF858_03680 [Candidatus Pacebacteria bacterium]|jgi:hypothetical protein|nr:hypothetical protein [bacterium]MDP6527945.1 hypothetical protein [Candidatus Paceibacterota bacterium]MDP6659476.1 hypothetical protein [Candidatus Paceibacterota bacterium]|tara:strand:- start:6612 stop:6923 length:312 start_codon:yes stop_codon:yes gene_type:complete
MLLRATRNAFLAELYIMSIVFVINKAVTTIEAANENSLLIPVVILSLLVLSVSVMAYLFLAEPLLAYLDGGKKRAANLFLYTISIFAAITAVIFLILLSKVVI